ncbi:conserved hypothetical protein [Frankia canadensis]|uniref:AtuA-like ferredoxin-fold domain-containing protein n=1 Tax=Frankia canadensis TaxID=1836972 RepID=A0A2I2KHZ0_9ACTN|nr:hypothetical protein [Frankia canadensis]SNQ45281.1 conserved hypothetical protein [Frankia canadensis]SOU52571.1 conserved hypothetical protein [Frankia canadensis]
MSTRVYDIAMARSGDKTDTSNVAVWPYDADDWEYLRTHLTIDRIKKRFGPLVQGEITRYEYPNIHVVNFVMTRALRGGVGLGLTLDPHGKAYQTLVLDIDLDDEI